VGTVAPGEIATIFGGNLTGSAGIQLVSSLPLPKKYLNVSVMVNGTAAALFAVDNVNGQQQINFQVPWEVGSAPVATIVVTSNGISSAPVFVPVSTAQPGIFSYSVGGQNFGAILHANFQLADAAHPAVAGETVLIYCTGLGAVSSPPGDGAAGNGQSTKAAASVTIGGVNAPVSFSGLAPGFVGLYQVNAEVPTGLGSGNRPVVLSIGGGSSNSVLLPVVL
jgi:minor extracellular serine protease Vpr